MSSIEDIAIKVGSYIPRSAGMGRSYLSGSFSIAPEKLAVPSINTTPRDEYIPSFPELNTQLGPMSADLNESEEELPNENIQNSGENPDENANDSAVDGEFTLEEQRVIDNLRSRDREVRDHEQAHISAGGAYIRGGASFEYENGPDNKRYAVGGEVSIDASPVRDNPEATIAKMQVVRSAALAPANPSGQDRAVAASASRSENQAHAELAEKRTADAQDTGGDRQQSRTFIDAAAAYANSSDTRVLQPMINIAV